MKRITALVLSAVMVFTLLPVHASEAEETPYTSAVETVKALGFMNGYPDGTFRPEGYVTRAEFACVIANLLNFYPDVSKGEATPFSDVTKSHWASPYVNIVNNNDLMHGYGNGQFLPEKNITVAEATKVMIELMGYGYFAQSAGGWPTGYQVQANTLDLLDGISTNINEPITRGEMAQLLCASFDVDIYTPDGYGVDVSIRKEDGVTLLSKYHDIYDIEGIVTANSFTAVNGDVDIRDNEVEIDGKRYFTDYDMTSYLGYNVKVYYRENNDSRTIIYTEIVDNDVAEISPESIGDINGYKINYFEDNGKKKNIEINSNSNIIRNNEFDCRAINFDLNTLSTVNGTLTFIDNDGDREYDVVIIKDYTVSVIDGVNINSEKINFKWGEQGLNLEDSKYTIYRDEEKITLSQLNSSDVLCIAASESFINGVPDSVVEIVVSTNTVNGSVVALRDGSVTIKTKDGKKEYKVSPEYNSEKGTNISIGDNGIFYLDVNGKITACLQDNGGKMKYGYLIHAIMNEGLMPQVQLKVLTPTGNVEIFTVKDNVRLDGEPVSATEMYETLASLVVGDQISMMMRYSVNADGLINAIDTEEPNTDNDVDELTVDAVNISGGMRYQSMGMMLVSYYNPTRYVIDPNVLVFAIPDAGSDDEDYKVYDNTYFVNEKYYGDVAKGQNMSVCNVKDGVPAAVVIKAGEAATNLGTIVLSDGPSAVIKSKLLVLDDEGEEQTMLILDSKGTEVELIITDKTSLFFSNGTNNVSNKLPGSEEELTIDDFNFGDVVMFDKGNKNRANVLLRINDSSIYDLEHGEYQVTGMSGYTEFIMGSVRKKNGTVLELDVSTEPNLYINAQRGPSVTLIENRTKTVTKTTLDEIWASDSDLEADKIFARVRFGNVAEIYIYR